MSVRVGLDDARAPGRPQAAEAQLSEGALLLLVAGEAASGDAEKPGWPLFSPGQKAQAGPGRLCIILTARVVRGGDPAPGAARGLGGTKP